MLLSPGTWRMWLRTRRKATPLALARRAGLAACANRETHMRAFIFPGQGSQSVGMGKALAEASPVARELFRRLTGRLARISPG
jgi:acyl transferase domain-containing protein